MEQLLRKLLLSGASAFVIAIVDAQFGDTGKGKLCDIIADGHVDVVVRGTGGSNAGHTVCVPETKERKKINISMHMLPCSILQEDVISIIGEGVAFDPRICKDEIDLVRSMGFSCGNLRIALNAHLVLPIHLAEDRLKERLAGKDKIGTTGRGIGPLYTDHVARIGFTVVDILNPKIFREKLVSYLNKKIHFFSQFDPADIKEVLDHEHLESGLFYDSEKIFDIDAIVKRYCKDYGPFFKKMISDTSAFLRSQVGKLRILLEGAQGVLLGVKCGTTPFVTSSDPAIAGLANGCGLRESDVDLTFTIVKAPFMTRVGAGPFPTEFGGKESDEWCSLPTSTKAIELERYGDVHINEADSEMAKGVAIRLVGEEYGATTKRPRRTGRLDLPLLRYALPFASRDLVLTKVDVMDDADEIEICTHYVYDGPDYCMGTTTLRKGDIIYDGTNDSFILSHCVAVYETFPGWKSKTSDIREYEKLPDELKKIVLFIEESTDSDVRAISVGPDRDQMIFRA